MKFPKMGPIHGGVLHIDDCDGPVGIIRVPCELQGDTMQRVFATDLFSQDIKPRHEFVLMLREK